MIASSLDVLPEVGKLGRDPDSNVLHGMTPRELLREQSIADIKAAIGRGTLVVICGTGVSVQSVKDSKVDGFDVVTWKGLLLHGIHRCEGLGIINAERAEELRNRVNSQYVIDLIQAAELITQQLTDYGSGAFGRWLLDAFSNLEVGDPSVIDALDKIASIFATLNYDSLIERRLGRASVPWKDSIDVDLAIDGRKVEAGGQPLDSVLHLHGHWKSADSVVFGMKSYEKVIAHDHAQAIQRLFATGKTILFVGCGGTLTDPNFKQYFDACGKILAETGRRHFILCREENESDFLGKAAWMHPVIYGKEYSELAPFLERLAEDGGKAAAMRGAPPPAPSEVTLGEEWLKATLKIKPELLTALLLAHRDAANEAVEKVASGNTSILGLQTRFPRSVLTFVAAHLAKHDWLGKPEAQRWVIVRDAGEWRRSAGRTDRKLVLVIHPALAFETNRAELAPLAQKNSHAIIYPTLLGRVDDPNVVALNEPSPSQVTETLSQYEIPQSRAQQLANQSNGNLPLLLRELAGTPERPSWAKEELISVLRPLALLGGWKANVPADVEAVAALIKGDYDDWLASLLPVFYGEEPPFVRTFNEVTAVSRYENWQVLAPYLTDQDLERFAQTAIRVLSSDDTKFDVPEAERAFAGVRGPTRDYSSVLRRGMAETVALIAGKPEVLRGCSPGKSREIAYLVVHGVLAKAGWKRWASLGSLLSLLAEADPDTYLKIIERDQLKPDQSILKKLLGQVEGGVFGGFYQSGLLWSLETLAWNPDYLTRVALVLADLDQFPLPENMMNRPLNSLRAIFLVWLPQTAADVLARTAAVGAIVKENPAVGWKLLLALLPESHSVGSYNPRPLWRDWIPGNFQNHPNPEDQDALSSAYADLALRMATEAVDRLEELLAHVAHLPAKIFDAVLNYLNGPQTAVLSERQRLPLWQKLVREAQRHRRFADTNWALPNWAVARIEQAAEAISPKSPEFRNQYWFNFHDHDLFSSEDYESDLKRISIERENALSEVLEKMGVDGLLGFAREVEHPHDLGVTAGQIRNDALDALLLPSGLEAPEEKIRRLTDGFIAAKYWKFKGDWLGRLPLKEWSAEQLGAFFSKLPFQREVWEAADRALGERNEEYWKQVEAFPRGTSEELLAALEKLIEHNRGVSALHAVNNLIRSKHPVPANLVLWTVRVYLDTVAKTQQLDAHELVTAVKQLQSDPTADLEELATLEWHVLPLLDRYHGTYPVTLERKLASSPGYFAEIITTCYRTKSEERAETEPDPARQTAAQLGHRLLRGWQSPPGASKEHGLNVVALNAWVDAVRERCTAAGRWEVAQIHIGHVLVYAPADPNGLWMHHGVAELLNAKTHEDMRRGFTMELFNSRGAHFSNGGKAERELAEKYKAKGKELDGAGFTRIAAALYELADSYTREAEREERQVLPGD